jgi:ketosteroid isomerase-like protein
MSEESTTPDLVELVRGFYESANRRDVDAALSLFACDAVWETAVQGSIEGTAAIREFLEDWRGVFEGYQIAPGEILGLGKGVVLAVTRHEARPAGSADGAPVREVWAYVFVWVDGMVARVAAYQDIDEARATAERLAESRG